MKLVYTVGLMVIVVGVSCVHSGGRPDLNRAYINYYLKKFEEAPEVHVASNIKKGDYRYWGFRERRNAPLMRWIPGVMNRTNEVDRYDVVAVGEELNDVTAGKAEDYFVRYNKILQMRRVEARKGGLKIGSNGIVSP